MGPAFNSLPDEWNLSQGAVQENIPADVVRYSCLLYTSDAADEE